MLIGAIYTWGQGVAVDYKRAMAAYKIAAEEGDAICQYELGVMYSKGEGIDSPDFEQALVWFEKAAAQDYPPAISNLGVLALHGQAQTPSWHRARKHYQRAIDLGSPKAAELMQELTGFIQQVTRSRAESFPLLPPPTCPSSTAPS